MKSYLLSLLFVTLFVSTSYACEEGELSFPQTKTCAKINWINGPSFNQYNNASVTLKNNQGLKLNIFPWMVMGGGHEHGSRPVKITEISPDDYLIEKIYFMGGMKGDWFLRLQLLKGIEIVEEVRVKVELE